MAFEFEKIAFWTQKREPLHHHHHHHIHPNNDNEDHNYLQGRCHWMKDGAPVGFFEGKYELAGKVGLCICISIFLVFVLK